MRLTLATGPLLDAVSLASAVASPKSPKRILECVAIRASSKDGVRIEASDFDVSLGLRLDAHRGRGRGHGRGAGVNGSSPSFGRSAEGRTT